MKIKDITNCEQVETIFKSSAFFAWNNLELLSKCGYIEGNSTLSVTAVKMKRTNCGLYSYNSASA